MATTSKNRILVPIDFSAQSLIALGQSYNLARITKAEITILFVSEKSSFFKSGTSEERNKPIQKKLDKIASDIYKEEKIEVDTMIAEGKVYEEIVDVAKKIRAKFILMGTNETGALKQFIGSNTLRVVREAPCPVITIKGAVHRQGCKNIVLPLDLTQETKEKVARAAEFAKYFNSSVRVVSLIDSEDEFIINKFLRQLNQVKEFIKEQGVDCTAETITGDNVHLAIINYAKKVKADLIMIMTQQERNLTELFVGSSAQQIINSSDIPVLSIRPSGKRYTTISSKTSLYS